MNSGAAVTIDGEYLLGEIINLHRNSEDFDDGDLSDRVLLHSPYELKSIDISILDLNEWEVLDYLVSEYIAKFNQNEDYPPIIVGIRNDRYVSIIDGIHRANALHELGIKIIKAYVGKEMH